MSNFHAVASDPEEVELICNLLSDLESPAAFQRYAEWLDSRDSDRAEFIRGLEQAVVAGAKLPRSKAETVTKLWRQCVGADLLAAIRKQDLGAVQSKLCKWVRPIVAIKTKKRSESAIPIGASRFGGRPDLPSGMKWPVCDRGPMGFLGQINLAEISHSQATAAFGLPKDGLLSLFVYQGDGIQPGVLDHVDGQFFEIEGLTQLHLIPADQQLERRDPDVELGEFNEIAPSCELHLSDGIDIPVAADTEDAELIAADDDFAISDLRRKVNAAEHWLMGYPVHSRTDNTSPGPDWSCLMSLYSDDKLYWCWCDGERLELFVHGESLNDGSFEKIFAYAS